MPVTKLAPGLHRNKRTLATSRARRRAEHVLWSEDRLLTGAVAVSHTIELGCPDGARRDAVDSDVVAGKVERLAAGQGEDRAFAGVIGPAVGLGEVARKPRRGWRSLRRRRPAAAARYSLPSTRCPDVDT